MSKKLLLSVLMSVGIVVGGFGVAYAFGTFHAIQQGFRQGGEGQGAKITMQVEAGTADANSALLPDPYGCSSPCAVGGGSLAFSITNTSDFPIRVTQIQEATVGCYPGPTCPVRASNKNENGTFASLSGLPINPGTCSGDLYVTPPTNFDNWPTIGPHSTLQVNGTDNNQLGAGMIHLNNGTPDGCQGALFSVGLKITATEMTGATDGYGFVP